MLLKNNSLSGEFITKPIILGNIYRQPKTLLQNYVDFINEFTHILTDLEKQNFDVIIAGDYNIYLLKIREKDIFNDFFESIISTSFFPKITLPTRFSGQKGTLIDNFICKISETLLDSLSGILIKNFSDHQPYFLCLKTIKHKKPPTEIKLVKDQSALFTQKILEDIKITNIIGKLNSGANADPNANYNIMESIIINSMQKHSTCKTVKYNKYKHKKNSVGHTRNYQINKI